MRFKVYRGNKIIEKSINLRPYKIDWDKPSRSKFQTNVKLFLRSFWENFFVYEEVPVAGSLMTLDFFCLTKRIAVEVQGKQHLAMVEHFHGRGVAGYAAFGRQLKRDLQKERFCELNEITLIEILPKDKLDMALARKLQLI